MVKKFIMVVLLIALPASGHTASIHLDATCSKFWNNLPSDAKVIWLHGYATAVANLGVIGTMVGEKETAGGFKDLLLPKGERIETVIPEIDAFCRDYKNRDAFLVNVMQYIVIKLNKEILP